MKEYKISKTIFDKDTILKVVYLWQEDFSISILEDSSNYILNIIQKDDNKNFNWSNFNAELQEQQLRECLNKQFGYLRDVIYAKAFEQFQG